MAEKVEELGSYVKSFSGKVLDTGEVQTTLTITGTQKALERLIGHAVVLENGTKKMLGKVTSFSVVEKQGKRVSTVKVIGARDLDSLGGCTVTLTKSQRELPGTEE